MLEHNITENEWGFFGAVSVLNKKPHFSVVFVQQLITVYIIVLVLIVPRIYIFRWINFMSLHPVVWLEKFRHLMGNRVGTLTYTIFE